MWRGGSFYLPNPYFEGQTFGPASFKFPVLQNKGNLALIKNESSFKEYNFYSQHIYLLLCLVFVIKTDFYKCPIALFLDFFKPIKKLILKLIKKMEQASYFKASSTGHVARICVHSVAPVLSLVLIMNNNINPCSLLYLVYCSLVYCLI